MAEDPSPCKGPKPSSPVDFPDLLWAKIFSYLPLKERFQISAVCRQWRDISRIPWSDIKRLDISDIPSGKMNPILSLTSVVAKITGRKRKILLNDKSMPPILTHLESLKLYDVCFAVQDSDTSNQVLQNHECLLSQYCDRFPKLSELILLNVTSVDSQGKPLSRIWTFDVRANPDRALLHFPNALGRSLRRLQLTYGWLLPKDTANLIAALNELEDLECLYLGSNGILHSHYPSIDALLTNFLQSVGKMQNLRELCLSDVATFSFDESVEIAAIACEKLHKLEVLIFASRYDISVTETSRLLTDHPTLKILVICGQTPLPCLQVFIGGPFLRYVRFTLPKSGAAIITEMDCSLPQFLAKPQVADVFKDVWAAKMIREGAEHDASWNSPSWSNSSNSESGSSSSSSNRSSSTSGSSSSGSSSASRSPAPRRAPAAASKVTSGSSSSGSSSASRSPAPRRLPAAASTVKGPRKQNRSPERGRALRPSPPARNRRSTSPSIAKQQKLAPPKSPSPPSTTRGGKKAVQGSTDRKSLISPGRGKEAKASKKSSPSREAAAKPTSPPPPASKRGKEESKSPSRDRSASGSPNNRLRDEKNRTPSPKPTKLCIGKLTRNVTKDHLSEIFSVYGTIRHIDMQPDRLHSHLHRGQAYVEFDNAEDAEKAFKYMDGGQIDGQEISAAPVLIMKSREGRRQSPWRQAAPNWRRSPVRYRSGDRAGAGGRKRMAEDPSQYMPKLF